MGCHSSRSNHVEPTSKPQESIKLDGDRVQESITFQESVKLEGNSVQESITLKESVKLDGNSVQESITIHESVKLDGNSVQESITIQESVKLEGNSADVPLILDGNAIKATNESLNEFFGPGYTTYILVNEKTEIDPPIDDISVLTADMLVLNSDPNPFVVPTLTLSNLIFQSILPPNYVLFVRQNGQEIAFVYQVFSSLGDQTTSPFFPPNSSSGDTIPCMAPEGSANPDDFLWTREGPDQDFQLHREQNETKFYWQFTGVEGIATLSDNPAQALSARLDVTNQMEI